MNVAEVADVLVRVKSAGREQVEQALSWLQAGGLTVVATNETIARLAGDIRSRHYHHRNCPISICDCVALATALVLDEQLATADPSLAEVGRQEGAVVVALPDSAGRRPD